MRQTIHDFAASLANGIAAEEAMADKLDATSQKAIEGGAVEMGEAMRHNARLHRAAAMKNRVRLSELIEQYGQQYGITMPEDAEGEAF